MKAIQKIALLSMSGLLCVLLGMQPSIADMYYQGNIARWVELSATANAPSEDSSGRLYIGSRQVDLPPEEQGVGFMFNVAQLTCRGSTWSTEERDTAPFEVYRLKVNGEPIVTFNTSCPGWGVGNGVPRGGDWHTEMYIQGAESLEGWLDYPATDPIHAEVYLESPMADPPTSTLVLEGWLVE